MRCYYYYLRTPSNKVGKVKKDGKKITTELGRKPIICICLIEDKGEIGRGMSICHDKDHFEKKSARGIARARAMAALKTKKTFLSIMNNHNLLSKLKSKLQPVGPRVSPSKFIPSDKITYVMNKKQLTPYEIDILRLKEGFLGGILK